MSGWELRTLRVSDISHGHSPDIRSENKRAEAKGKTPPPIYVKPRGSKWRVHDGNDRLHFARRRGDSHIEAYVPVMDDKPAKKRGWIYWE